MKFKTTIDYLNFVHEFHNTMKEQDILLAYEGKVTHDIMIAFTEMAETNLRKNDEESITDKVYHVMVECLQNICKHADNQLTAKPGKPGEGIFLVGSTEKQYNVTTGNPIANEKVKNIKTSIDRLNSMDKDELKAAFKKQIVENRLSDKGDAGLGLIDIARKTGQKIEYHFKPINDKTTFFLLNINIPRK